MDPRTDRPTDRQTHGLTPPPTLYYPHGLWCHCRCSLTAHSMGRTPPPPTAPSPADVLQHLAQGVCAWGGGERGSPHAAPSPLLSNPPQRDQKGRTRRRDPFLARPPPCPPLPPGFPTTHTHASIPPAMCVPMQEVRRKTGSAAHKTRNNHHGSPERRNPPGRNGALRVAEPNSAMNAERSARPGRAGPHPTWP